MSIITLIILLVLVSLSVSEIPACSTCKDTTCVILPPDDYKNYPCYEGAPVDAAKCFKTDPLLKENATWACGNCASFGYTKYLRQDPLYTEMALWVRTPLPKE